MSETTPRRVRARHLAWLLLALFGALVVVVLARSAFFPSRQRRLPPFELAVDVDVAGRRLSDALRHPTISRQDGRPEDPAAFEALYRDLEAFYPKVHTRLGLERFEQFTRLYHWPGKDPSLPAVLFIAHADVVPAGDPELWHTPPFAGTIRAGKLCGRGALDNKHNLLAILEAFERALSVGFSPKRGLYLLVSHDEETISTGARAVASALSERGQRLEAVFDEGLFVLDGSIPGISRPAALIGVSEKGYLSLEITARGRGGHASRPPAELAIDKLARVTQRLLAHPMPARLDPPMSTMFDYLGPEMSLGYRTLFANRWLFGGLLNRMLASGTTEPTSRTTMAPTMLRAGERDNVLPTEASLTVNFRLHPRDSVARVIAHVRATIDDPEVSIEPVGPVTEPRPIASIESRAFRALQDTLAEVFPEALVAPALFIARTDSYPFVPLTRDIYRFSPITLSMEQARMHGPNECLDLAGYARMIRHMTRLVERLGA